MTKFTKLIGLIAMFSLWTTPAKAEFVFIGETNDGISMYVDDRIHRNGPFVWFTFRGLERDNSGDIRGHIQGLYSGDCRTGAVRLRKFWVFIDNYQTVNSFDDYDDNGPLNYYAPDSLGYGALRYACNN